MTTHSNETPARVRVAATLGPEVLAVLLIGLLAVGGIVVWLGSATAGSPRPSSSAAAVVPTLPIATPSPTPLTTVVPTSSPTRAPTAAPTAAPSAAPTASLTATPIPTPTPTPRPTPSPPRSPTAWAAAAQTLFDADQRVLEWREALRAEVDRNPKRADDFARLIRSTNSAIQISLGALDALDATPASPAIITGLRAAHTAALDVGVQTLAIRLTDTKAYRAGAKEIVGHLDELDPLLRDLAADAGLADPVPPPSPSASASVVP